jgi:hypothetical protein
MAWARGVPSARSEGAADGAGVALDRSGRYVVYPIAEIFHGSPVRIVDADAADGALGAAVRTALETVVDPETSLAAHREDLRTLGLTLGELDSSPKVSVHVKRRRVELEGWRADGRPAGADPQSIGVRSDEDLGANIRRLFESLGGANEVPDGPLGASFGYKLSWLAVRGSDSSGVSDALGLERTEPAEWEEGVARAYDGETFVSPRTGGWVFVLHVGWPDDRPPDVADLSKRLATEVQYFATHRVPELHTWTRAEAGHITRTLRYVGESGEATASGEPTEVERRLGFDWIVGDEDELPELDDVPDEDAVMQVAGAWSVDPQTLGGVSSESTTGFVGSLPGR